MIHKVICQIAARLTTQYFRNQVDGGGYIVIGGEKKTNSKQFRNLAQSRGAIDAGCSGRQ